MAKKTPNAPVRAYEAGGIAFVGCIILGTGLGLLYNEIVVGTMVGVGFGFLAMALLISTSRS